eukprot:4509556-Prymnesium_polylepis.1
MSHAPWHPIRPIASHGAGFGWESATRVPPPHRTGHCTSSACTDRCLFDLFVKGTDLLVRNTGNPSRRR